MIKVCHLFPFIMQSVVANDVINNRYLTNQNMYSYSVLLKIITTCEISGILLTERSDSSALFWSNFMI